MGIEKKGNCVEAKRKHLVRVYILGAGFSLHAGYPLANGLLDEMDKFVKSDRNADAELKAQWAEMQHMLANGYG